MNNFRNEDKSSSHLDYTGLIHKSTNKPFTDVEYVYLLGELALEDDTLPRSERKLDDTKFDLSVVNFCKNLVLQRKNNEISDEDARQLIKMTFDYSK